MLDFVQFSKLSNWSVSHLNNHGFCYNEEFPLVRLGDFLIKNTDKVVIKDETLYTRVTVKINNGGVKERNKEWGKNIGTKQQFIVRKGQFIMSKIDARNGAMGLIPNDLDGAIVTNDFPTFSVDESKISPDFLLLITTTKKFIEFAQMCSSGTTNRQRINVKQFLDVEIPLPPLSNNGDKKMVTQLSIVDSYKKQISQSDELMKSSLKQLQNAENYLNSTLKINVNEDTEVKKGLQFVSFKDLDRWDTEFLLKESLTVESKYPMVKYGEIFKSTRNGISARNYSSKGVRFIKVSDIKRDFISDDNVYHIDTYNESDLISNDTLLITRKGTVGNSVYISNTDSEITASSEVFIISIDSSKVSGDFISAINNAGFVQRQYKEKNTGTIMPSISQKKLFEITIPIPPSILEQEEIASHYKSLLEKAFDLRDQSKSSLLNANSNFESKIFSTL
ncbi:restriction endonuclease subunit S [Flammeovirga kamogawensis]|nr:restriction endonuclease subunit S [Flammeovirga kamogawensis]MBB6461971.1 restriction endonuclease S subunit [Flammeovirga kamogawensis]